MAADPLPGALPGLLARSVAFDWHPAHAAKIVSLAGMREGVARVQATGKRVAAAAGSFNILMYHHARYLEEARALADFLVVLVNSDASLQAYKNRSGSYVAIPAAERMGLLAALPCVDLVAAFAETNSGPALEVVRPDLYVRGGDYAPDRLSPPERDACARLGIPVRFTTLRDYTATGWLIREIIARAGKTAPSS